MEEGLFLTHIAGSSYNLNVKQINHGSISFLRTCRFSLHRMLTDGLELCGLCGCFYQLFGLIYISDDLRVRTFSAILFFW